MRGLVGASLGDLEGIGVSGTVGAELPLSGVMGAKVGSLLGLSVAIVFCVVAFVEEDLVPK